MTVVAPAPPRQRPLLGIALILLMGASFAASDTAVKFLGQVLPVLALLFIRYLSQAAIMAVWLVWRGLRGGGNLFRAKHVHFQVVRAVLLLACSTMVMFGLRLMPVAEFTAVGMLTPVIVTVLAAMFLHERVSPLRSVLVVACFAGALVVVRPGGGLFGWPALVPLAMALFYAAFQLLTRQYSGLENPLTTHFYSGLIGTAIAVLGVLALEPEETKLALQNAPASTWWLLGLVGCASTAGHLCLIFALGVAPIPVLMPFTYLQIGFASLGGWLVFRHVPDGWAFLGMAVIAACGAASVWLNFRESNAVQHIAPSDSALMAD